MMESNEHRYQEELAEWHSQNQGGDAPAPPKPVLLILLPELIHQWSKEIRDYSQSFNLRQYYGDSRSRAPGAITSTLTWNDPIFTNPTPRTLILTTMQTMVKRHGPGTLEIYRLRTLDLPRSQNYKLEETEDSDWDNNL
jgi:hypothetical protein